MKKSFTFFKPAAVLVLLLVLIQSCDAPSPFEGVNAILTNVKIDHNVNIQITDANPNATNPYPANAVLTLAGEAVDQGLLYTSGGNLLNTSAGSAKVINNTVSIVVKPFTIISKTKPLRFYIKAEAPNYLSNTKEISIGSIDSLQYVNLSLLKISSLPDGVSNSSAQAATSGGTLTQNFVVNVKAKISGSSATETVVVATFPANTVFKDASNRTINTTGSLNVSVTNFNSTSPESVSALPGGITANADGVLSTFVLAGAIDINANIDGTVIKSFSNPIPFEMNLSNQVYNPSTQNTIKVGDQLPIWSKDAHSVIWKKEGTAVVFADSNTGALKTIIQVSHLSTWSAAFAPPPCENTTLINYVSNSNTAIAAFVKVTIVGGSKQTILSRTVSIKNGGAIELKLPQNLSLLVSMYTGGEATGQPFSTLSLAPCASSGTLTNSLISTNPVLSFDLQTSCRNGLFRYSGPIEYRVSGSRLWIPFSPSVEGKLSTNLLAWDVTYDFRIIYRDVEFKRSRKVVQAEFRTAADGGWDYFGRTAVKETFFRAPTSCD